MKRKDIDSQSKSAALLTDNGEYVDVNTTVAIICNGMEVKDNHVPTMYIKMESPVKPIVMFDDSTPACDFSQFMMDKTCGQLEHISHIKKPNSNKYNRLYNSVQSSVSNANSFRLTYNLRTLTAATLKAILYTVANVIADIKPRNPEMEQEANYEKSKCVEQFEDVFSEIMMTFSQYRHPYAMTLQKDSPYEDAYVMARVVEEGNRWSFTLANRIFDTLYGILFANLDARIIASIAEELTPILALYRTNVISVLLRGTMEQSDMNYFENISPMIDHISYDDDYDF